MNTFTTPPTPVDPVEREHAAVLARLTEVGQLIEQGERVLEGYYQERLALYQAGKGSEPRITLSRMAAAAGVSEVAVSVALSKAKAKAAKAGT